MFRYQQLLISNVAYVSQILLMCDRCNDNKKKTALMVCFYMYAHYKKKEILKICNGPKKFLAYCIDGEIQFSVI